MGDPAPLDFPPHRGRRTGRLRLYAPELRLAECRWSSGARLVDGNGEAHTLDLRYSAADLSAFENGTAPLLSEHSRCIDAVVGRVVAGWLVEGVAGYATVRFGRHEAATRILEMIEDEMPLKCSIGYYVTASQRAPDYSSDNKHHICLRWRPYEISICVFGADENAMISKSTRFPSTHEALAEFVEAKRAERAEREREKRLAGLHAPAWRHWAQEPGAAELAARLGLDVATTGAALGAVVEAQLGRLEAAVGDLEALAEQERVNAEF